MMANFARRLFYVASLALVAGCPISAVAAAGFGCACHGHYRLEAGRADMAAGASGTVQAIMQCNSGRAWMAR